MVTNNKPTKPTNWSEEYLWDSADPEGKDVNLAKATKKADGLPDDIRKMDSGKLIGRGAELIHELTSRTGQFRLLAEVVVSLRLKYKTANGLRDLNGRSTDYRAAVREMYKRAGVPVGLDQGMQQAIRYHVRKLVWLESTPNEQRLLKLADPFAPAPDTSRVRTTTPGTSGNGQGGDSEEITDPEVARQRAREEEGPMTLPGPDNPMLLAMTMVGMCERIDHAIHKNPVTEKDREKFVRTLTEAVEILSKTVEFVQSGEIIPKQKAKSA